MKFLFVVLGLIYVPMGILGYYSLGDQAEANIVLNPSPGPARIIIEVMLLMHLISAFPILINPPCQYFEQLFKIPSGNFFKVYPVLLLVNISCTNLQNCFDDKTY